MTPPSPRKPLVLVPSCRRSLAGHAFQVAGEKYLQAVRLAGCLPLVVAAATPDELPSLLALADGVLLTGSPSNVHPRHYGEALHDTELPLDPERDAWVLALVPQVLARGIPLLAICRGAQETNVALGGTLHQAVHELPAHADHRSDASAAPEQQYAAAHPVQVAPGGVLSALLDRSGFDVNSLHGQGVARLAPGLRAEAHAPDGLIEAFSMPAAAGFNLCVQWHPEWQAAGNPVSMRLLHAFGQACQRHRQQQHRDRIP